MCEHDLIPFRAKGTYVCQKCWSTIEIKSITYPKDSRWKSFTEITFNTIIGFVINYFANFWILPHYGVPPNPQIFLEIGIWFTLISVIRGYGIRRFFERMGVGENFYTLTMRLVKKLR